jgi:hypothetical protein
MGRKRFDRFEHRNRLNKPNLYGKEAVPGSSPGEGLNTCKTALFHNYRVPPESGRGRGSSRRQPRKLPANRGLVPSSRAPPCCGGPRRSGRYRPNPKSLENAKISVAAAAGAEHWGQVLGSRAWPHGPTCIEWSGARVRKYCEQQMQAVLLYEQQMKAVLLYVHARAGKDRRASAPLCELRPPIARVSCPRRSFGRTTTSGCSRQ